MSNMVILLNYLLFKHYVWLLAHLKKLTLTLDDVVAEPRGYTKSQQNVNEDYFEEWKYVLEMNVTHLL